MVAQEEEWQLYAPEGRPSEIHEHPLKIPGIWAEDNSLGLAQNGGSKSGSHSHQPETVFHSL
jgi:hypothetical protein